VTGAGAGEDSRIAALAMMQRRPLCPFDDPANQRINFPDVLDALPLLRARGTRASSRRDVDDNDNDDETALLLLAAGAYTRPLFSST